MNFICYSVNIFYFTSGYICPWLMKDGSQIHPVGTYWLGSEDTDMRKIELLPLRSRQSVAREDKRREEILCALVHSEVLSIALRGTYYL